MASVVGEKVGGRHGEQIEDVDGTSSSDDVDSKRVEGRRLAANSQYTRNNAKSQQNYLPVSPEPPTKPPNSCYKVAKPNCGRTRRTIPRLEASDKDEKSKRVPGRAIAMRSIWSAQNRFKQPKNLVSE